MIDTWCERSDALGRRSDCSSVLVFENRGATVGTSNPHPHGQIYAGALVYGVFDREDRIAASIYYGMVAPLIPFAIRGAIWYQGESNEARAEQYGMLLPVMKVSVQPQVVLGGVRELREVGQAAAVLRAHSGFVELAPVHLDVVVGVPQRPLQAAQLQLGELVGRGTLGLGQLRRVRCGHRLSSPLRSSPSDLLWPRNSAMVWPSRPSSL